MLTLVATEDGEIVGFASLKGADHIEMIYVDPEFARHGVGATLARRAEKIARARGAAKLTGEVSDTAKPLFDRQGSCPSSATSSRSTRNGSATRDEQDARAPTPAATLKPVP